MNRLSTTTMFGIVMVCSLVPTALASEAPQLVQTDLLIVGGTESGCAAALQAARMGVKSITLVNDSPMLGGQFSEQGLCAVDENADRTGVRHEPTIPRSGIFKEIVDRIEAINLRKYGNTRPGNTRVLATCRPADAAGVFEELLAPHVRAGRLRILRKWYPVGTRVEENRLVGVRFASIDSDRAELVVTAKLTIDASDWGDVIRLSGADYEFGPDLKSKYDEPEAPTSREKYPVTDMNPITYTMVIVESDTAQPIARPANYDARNYDKLPYPTTHEFFYASRRLIDGRGFKEVKSPDVILLCHPAQDYPLDVLPRRVRDALEANERGASRKNIAQMSRAQREIIFNDAKQHSLGLLYWLQTSLHDQLENKDRSFRRFVLTDEFGTPDRLPPKPYIREGLRLRAMHMMRQQDTLGDQGESARFAKVMYPDAVAAWQFEYDFHPTQRRFVAEDEAGPWHARLKPLRNWGPPFSGRATFPMRSLIPEKLDGLLGAEHNLGFSSIVSSAVRLHDHCTAIGQAAGATAAVALKHEVHPRTLPSNPSLLAEVQTALCSGTGEGEPMVVWPYRDLQPGHASFAAAQLLALRQALPFDPKEVDFRPDAPATDDWRKDVVARTLAAVATKAPPTPPAGDFTRGEFVRQWWVKVKDLPVRRPH